MGNRSTGKMGYALAAVAQAMGARVTLVSGPSQERVPFGVRLIAVESAEEMGEAVLSVIDDVDLFLSAAAVADWRPAAYSADKLKKGRMSSALRLERTIDILGAVSKRASSPLMVGFSLETTDGLESAYEKLKAKSLDMIVANQESTDTGLAGDLNAVTCCFRDREPVSYSLQSKVSVAQLVLTHASDLLYDQQRLVTI
jgi:phosphopantothenoylcysteine decarboxylase/phosphopantothenate--cysteine ligase